MEIVSENTHRLLAYVDGLNRHGVKPTCYIVDAFGGEHERASRQINRFTEAYMPSVSAVSRIFGTETIWDESASSYLGRLGWISGADADQVQLTRVGKALLKALNAPSLDVETSPLAEIVLGTDDPFAYAQALQALGGAGPALLVDPYLRVQNLIDLDLDNINRILVGTGLKSNEYAALAVAIGAVNESRPLEVRKSAALHDRCLIPDDGLVLTLGVSLGGIGKKVSALTTLGEPASQGLRVVYEQIWQDAEPIKPTTPPTGLSATVEASPETPPSK